jgi:hypothetical protein
MKTAIITTGIASLMFGVIVEIIGVFYGSDALQHNAYGGWRNPNSAWSLQFRERPRNRYSRTVFHRLKDVPVTSD